MGNDDAPASPKQLARDTFVRTLAEINRWPHAKIERDVLLAAFDFALEVFTKATAQEKLRAERAERDDDPPYPF